MSETPVLTDRISILKKDNQGENPMPDISNFSLKLFSEQIDSSDYYFWEMFIVNFQKYWVDVFLILKYLRLEQKQIWKDINQYFLNTSYDIDSDKRFFTKLEKIIDIDGVKIHSIFRCYTAAGLLQLFLKSNTNDGKTLKANTISFKGSPFPDHIWLEIRDNTRTYILQAFYYAYTFNGTYGLYRLDEDTKKLYYNTIKKYERLSKQKPRNNEWKKELAEVNAFFQYFTGVNISDHETAEEYIKWGFESNNPIEIKRSKMFNISIEENMTNIAINRMRRLIEGVYIIYNFYNPISNKITWYNSSRDKYYIFRCELYKKKYFDIEFIGLRSEIDPDGCFFKTETECIIPCRWINNNSECIDYSRKWENYKHIINEITVDLNSICFSLVSTLDRIQQYDRNVEDLYLKYVRDICKRHSVRYIFDDVPMDVDPPSENKRTSRMYLGVPIS